MVPFLLAAAWCVVKDRYVAAGLSFGLALAAKNTAIFMLPAVAAFLLWRWWRTDSPLAKPARGFLVTVAFAAAALVPFANPVSYAREIATPVSGREYDPRGEDVSSFTLHAQALDSEVRQSVRQLQRVIPWYAFLAFVLLGILACGPRLRDPMVALSFFFLLMMFPHSLVFGQGLGYRSLMFAPFFCLAAVRLSTTRWCVPAIALLAAADVVVLLDPLSARG
jgi:4-amino-4-deoxy-L-arabinose transferase-like glycosyltransferase